MLCISRKPGESVLIDGKIRVYISRIDRGVVRLGFEAPKDIPILRTELIDREKKPSSPTQTTPA